MLYFAYGMKSYVSCSEDPQWCGIAGSVVHFIAAAHVCFRQAALLSVATQEERHSQSSLLSVSFTGVLSYGSNHPSLSLIRPRQPHFRNLFDFAIAKSNRHVGLTGMASASEIDDDVAFLFVCSGFPHAANPQRNMIKNLLEPLYAQLHLREFNGRSYDEITARKA